MGGTLVRNAATTCLVAAMCALPAIAFADGAATPGDIVPNLQNARQFDLALFAPSAPGFVVLGMSPRRSADPGSFKTFGFDVADLSNGGNFNVGGALSFEPFWWGHQDLTLKGYEQDTTALERIFARTQVSVAASYVSQHSFSYESLGIAAQAQLLDAQDERYDPHSYDCLLQAWQTIRQPSQQAADDAVFDYLTSHPDATQDDLTAVRNAALNKGGAASAQAFATARSSCQDAAELNFLSKPSWMVGVGGRTRTLDASFHSPRLDGGSVWTTYRQPVVEDGLISLEFFGLYSFSGTLDLLDNDITADTKGNEYDVGTGIALERTWWKADAAVTYISQNMQHPPLGTQDFTQISVSGAVRIREGLWVQVSGGDSFGDNTRPFFGLGVKYDWSNLAG